MSYNILLFLPSAEGKVTVIKTQDADLGQSTSAIAFVLTPVLFDISPLDFSHLIPSKLKNIYFKVILK